MDIDIQLYTVAATILKKSRAKEACLKKLIFESHFNNIPKLTAFANEFMKHIELIEEVFSHCQGIGLLKEDIVKGKSEIALAFLYEQLLGNEFGKNVALRKVMLKYKAELRSAVDKVIAKYNVKSLKHLSRKINSKSDNIKIARFLRVNLLHASPDQVIQQLQEEGWAFVGKIEAENFRDRVLSLREDQFGLDPLLFDVLVFPVGTVLYNHPLILSGTLIQQDKASCIPVHVLNPPSGSVVLDCCAAPGNKTSHLACLMKDEGSIIAMDRDLRRMKTMANMLTKIGASSVQLVHQDFLTVRPDSEDAKNVQYILVDPSCSGSGMLGVQQKKDIYDTDESRLHTLSRFQATILRHALSFPNTQRVVYSTCSIHQEENEQVVEQAMSHFSDQFEFSTVFPQCKKSRGVEGHPHSKYFLRLNPENDLTQGFFVACFQRKEATSARRADKYEKEEVVNIHENRKRKISENVNHQASVESIDKTVTSHRTSKKKKSKCKKEAAGSLDHTEDLDVEVVTEIEGGHTSIPPEEKKHKKHKSSTNNDNGPSRDKNKKIGNKHHQNNLDQNLDIEAARKSGDGNMHSDKKLHKNKKHRSTSGNDMEPTRDTCVMKRQKKCEQDKLDNDLDVQVDTKNSDVSTHDHDMELSREKGRGKKGKKCAQDNLDPLHQNKDLQIESSDMNVQPSKKKHKKHKSSTDLDIKPPGDKCKKKKEKKCRTNSIDSINQMPDLNVEVATETENSYVHIPAKNKKHKSSTDHGMEATIDKGQDKNVKKCKVKSAEAQQTLEDSSSSKKRKVPVPICAGANSTSDEPNVILACDDPSNVAHKHKKRKKEKKSILKED